MRSKTVLRFSYLHSCFLNTSEHQLYIETGLSPQLPGKVEIRSYTTNSILIIDGVTNSYQPVIHILHSQSHNNFSYLLINQAIQWAFNCQNLWIALSYFPSRSAAESLKIWGSVRRDARSRQSCLCVSHPLNTTATRRNNNVIITSKRRRDVVLT